MNKHTFVRLLVITTIVCAFARLALADCDFLRTGSHCGDNKQTAKIGQTPPGNNCTEIKYTVNGDETLCTPVGEGDCGFNACNKNSVKIVRILNVYTSDYNSLSCVYPLLPGSGETIVGTCIKDSIPGSADVCGCD